MTVYCRCVELLLLLLWKQLDVATVSLLQASQLIAVD